jgi:hypothetical protein
VADPREVIPQAPAPVDPAVSSEVTAATSSAEVSQQPGFKVVDEAPTRVGSKLVWTALIVVLAILAGYYLGYFR